LRWVSLRNLAVPGRLGMIKNAMTARIMDTSPYFRVLEWPRKKKDRGSLTSKKKIFFHVWIRPHCGIFDSPMASKPPNAPLAEDAEM
jgi:hypothetical protein